MPLVLKHLSISCKTQEYVKWGLFLQILDFSSMTSADAKNKLFHSYFTA